MRPPSACVACRNRRRKCEIPEGSDSCAWCIARGLECSFARPSQQDALGSPRTSPAQTTSGDFEGIKGQGVVAVPPKAVQLELVDLYFRYIHDTFHTIFHRPTVMQEVSEGRLPRVILYAMMSLSARFSEDNFFAGIDPRARGRCYAEQAQALLDLREISLTTIQACVLIGAYLVTEGEGAAEAVFYGIACRNALLLDLPGMLTFSRLDEETNRRVWWSLSMIDVWSSSGMRIPRSLAPRNDVFLPMEETAYLAMRRDDSNTFEPSAVPSDAPSLLAQMVKLNAILFEVNQLNERAANIGTPYSEFESSHDDAVIDLDRRLDAWYTSLPQEMLDTPENMARYAALGLGPMFVAVYLGYYHYGALLHYRYLHEDSWDDNMNAHFWAEKCREYSTRLCQILYRAYATPNCEVYYTMVGHVLVIASTVQLHILLFSSDEMQIQAARLRLEKNFEILTRLQSYWPTLDVCFTRFREFHKACQSYTRQPFRMDRWMSRFLFEFAKPMGERDSDDLTELMPWSMEVLGFSPLPFNSPFQFGMMDTG